MGVFRNTEPGNGVGDSFVWQEIIDDEIVFSIVVDVGS